MTISPALLLFAAAFSFFEKVVDRLADELDVYQVHPRVGFVEHDERGVLADELQQLGALDLAPGKTEVDVPFEEIGQVQFPGKSGDLFRREISVFSTRRYGGVSPSLTPLTAGGR